MLEDDDEGDDRAKIDFPKIFALIGPAAVPALGTALRDVQRPVYARWNAADSLSRVAEENPSARNQVLPILIEQLQLADEVLTNGVIAALLDLKAVEAASEIERAYKEDRVDEFLIGTWESAQWELGLTDKEPERKIPPYQSPFFPVQMLPMPSFKTKTDGKAKKKKRKEAAKARKRNRKQ